MHHRVADLRHSLGKSRLGRVVDVWRDVVGDEERSQRMSQFRLAGAFGPEQRKDGKRGCDRGHHVLEQRGEQEAERHLGVVPEDGDQSLGIFPERDAVGLRVDELPRQLVALCVVPRVEGASRKIELLSLDVDDPILVNRLECPVVQSAVAPCVEAPFLLPPQLLDLVG